MIGLEVKLNGSVISVAGESGNKFISSDITISFDSNHPHRRARATLMVCGGNGDKTVQTWVYSEKLQVGDKITFKVIETDKTDEPISRDTFE